MAIFGASRAITQTVTLGHPNHLFVGDVDAGMSIAGTSSRMQDHPKRRLDELLPGAWARARADA